MTLPQPLPSKQDSALDDDWFVADFAVRGAHHVDTTRESSADRGGGVHRDDAVSLVALTIASALVVIAVIVFG